MESKDYDLIVESFDRELTSVEAASLKEILSRSEGLSEYKTIEIIRRELASLGKGSFPSDFEDKVMAKLGTSPSAKLLTEVPKRKNRYYAISMAACFTILMAAGAAFWMSPIEHSAPNGEIVQITLPDGSELELKSGSNLSYKRFALRSQREVELEGNAFFKVAKDASKPFIVKSFNAHVEVTGTQFDVKASYLDQEKGTKVFVHEGSVLVQHLPELGMSSEAVSLSAQQQTVVYTNSSQLAVKQANPEKEMAWRSGGLVFENTPMSKVVVELEKRFGTRFTAQSAEILDRKITYYEKTPDSLDQVIDDISNALNIQYQKTQEGIIFLHSE